HGGTTDVPGADEAHAEHRRCRPASRVAHAPILSRPLLPCAWGSPACTDADAAAAVPGPASHPGGMVSGPVVLAAALERQAALLAPVAAHLAAASAHPPIAPADWGGPASRAFAELEGRLRAQLARADEAVAAALHGTRIALGRVRSGVIGG